MYGVINHPIAEDQSSHIGEGTTISQNRIILSGDKIGKKCNTYLFMKSNVTARSGVQL